MGPGATGRARTNSETWARRKAGRGRGTFMDAEGAMRRHLGSGQTGGDGARGRGGEQAACGGGCGASPAAAARRRQRRGRRRAGGGRQRKGHKDRRRQQAHKAGRRRNSQHRTAGLRSTPTHLVVASVVDCGSGGPQFRELGTQVRIGTRFRRPAQPSAGPRGSGGVSGGKSRRRQWVQREIEANRGCSQCQGLPSRPSPCSGPQALRHPSGTHLESLRANCRPAAGGSRVKHRTGPAGAAAQEANERRAKGCLPVAPPDTS